MRARSTTGLERNPESGFALLFVYAMAATVAIMLYMELPRVAFEAQRDKEQLLIDRGEQYTRAINLFVRKFNRYPADFDALQNTQNQRFLRHKYVDPMTGKDDWRIIHVGPGGVFTDSLLYTKKKDDKQTEQQSFITEMQQTGGNQTSATQQGANIGTRQRPSDQPGAPGDLNNPGQPPALDPNGQPIPTNPNGAPPNGFNGPVQVLPDGRIVPVSQAGPQQPGNQAPPGAPFPGGQFPGGQFPGGQFPPGVQPGAIQNQGAPQGQQQPGQLANAPPAAAAGLINQILTSPRPGGFNGFGGQQQAAVDQNGNPVPNQQNGNGFGANPTGAGISPGAAGNLAGLTNTGTALPPMAGQTIGGGIAGVATKLEQDGIKVYHDRTAYNEWEFVYDITKDTSRGGGAQQQGQAGAQTGAQAGAQAGAQPGAQSQTGFQNGMSQNSSASPTPTSTGK
jgi:hypothetical protein